MRDLQGIRAFIFDMDGTLIDSMRYWRGENRNFLQRHNLPVPEDMKNSIDTLSSHAFARRMAQDYPDRFTYEGVICEYEEKLKTLYATVIPSKPGAGEFLDFLAEKGLILSVATATKRSMACIALDRLGFLEKLDFVTDGTDIGTAKGDAQYFLRLAEKLGVKPEECVLFEDSLYAMKSGKAAGLTVFAIEEWVVLHDQTEMRNIRETADLFVRDFFEARQVMQNALHSAP